MAMINPLLNIVPVPSAYLPAMAQQLLAGRARALQQANEARLTAGQLAAQQSLERARLQQEAEAARIRESAAATGQGLDLATRLYNNVYNQRAENARVAQELASREALATQHEAGETTREGMRNQALLEEAGLRAGAAGGGASGDPFVRKLSTAAVEILDAESPDSLSPTARALVAEAQAQNPELDWPGVKRLVATDFQGLTGKTITDRGRLPQADADALGEIADTLDILQRTDVPDEQKARILGAHRQRMAGIDMEAVSPENRTRAKRLDKSLDTYITDPELRKGVPAPVYGGKANEAQPAARGLPAGGDRVGQATRNALRTAYGSVIGPNSATQLLLRNLLAKVLGVPQEPAPEAAQGPTSQPALPRNYMLPTSLPSRQELQDEWNQRMLQSLMLAPGPDALMMYGAGRR